MVNIIIGNDDVNQDLTNIGNVSFDNAMDSPGGTLDTLSIDVADVTHIIWSWSKNITTTAIDDDDDDSTVGGGNR